jgi:hypothetical protein
MDALQTFLNSVVDLGDEFGEYADGTWYAVVINDPDELGQNPTSVGMMLKIAGEPGERVVVNTTTYNR